MKCPICNAENGPDANSCHQCGFSLSLSQAAWPDFPTIEIPDPLEIEIQPAPPESKEATKIESVEDAVEIIATKELPPDQPSDDELAREHVARGFEAIRQGMLDQARWELEQARDLADSKDIAYMAQSQLNELSSAAAPIVQRRPIPLTPTRRPTLIKPPSSTLALDQIVPADWVSTVRTGLIAGAVNGIVAGGGAQSCCGFFLSLAVAFVTGMLIARQAGKGDQSSDAIHAIIAGGITGLGGWLGQVIGSIIWAAALSSAQPNTSTWPFVACIAGIVYIPAATALSTLGWKMGTPKHK
ncbi:MAG: hypothetical protein DRJ03_05540 [Chloroflexi bacterium]|nr:MAG: hypothetical protein DRI81_00980 [Chloroflexota bacterium]RLC87578.1 MAG: hypothetical protein DRJ03_05540 [Chloroflexota bacterium]